MKKRLSTLLFSLPVALMLAAGGVHAQFKAPTKTQAQDPLGRGLGSGLGSGSAAAPSAPSTPGASPNPAAPATPASSGTEEKSSPEAVVQEIANCVMAGLPAGWTMAQIDVREIGRKDMERNFEAIYSYLDADGKAGPFTPCDPREPALNVYKLNGALEPAKRNWIRATLVFSSEGKFELQYDYAPTEAKGATEAPAPVEKVNGVYL